VHVRFLASQVNAGAVKNSLCDKAISHLHADVTWWRFATDNFSEIVTTSNAFFHSILI